MTSAPPRRPWWSGDLPPWETWPGVSLELRAEWSTERDRWESPCGKYWFDVDAADGACASFSDYLVHIKGEWAGQPFELLPWQRDLIVRPLFGWKRAHDNLRRFRKVFVEVGKKNGKSGLASGLGLLLAFGDGEPGAEVYAVASDRDQARIVFGDSKAMARANPAFLDEAGVQVLQNAIVQAATNSTYKALSAEVGSKHGFSVHGLVLDEFHSQRGRDLYDALYKGTSARRQPVVLIITTAGDDRESICYEEYSYAKNVRDGVFEDEQYLPVVFEPAPDADWTLEETWRKANPSLGVTKSLEYMAAECAAAQAEPRKRNSFLRLELNIWTESRTVWIAPEAWEACESEPADDLAELPCCGGLDLSSAVDLTAFALVFKRPDELPPQELEVTERDDRGEEIKRRLSIDYAVDVRVTFWLPRERLREAVRRDRVPYDLWAREGWLRVTDGNVIDQNAIFRFIEDEVRPRYPKLHQIGYDRWSALPLVTSLAAEGAPLVEVGQGYQSLSAPSKLFEALVLSRRIHHDGNPVMRWCVANAEVKSDPAGNIKPVKPGGADGRTRRVDGVVATVIALSRLIVMPDVTESPGITMIRW